MIAISWPTLAGVGLDLLFGDPRGLPHPVRAIGWFIGAQERMWRRSGAPLRLAGAALWFVTVGVTGGIVVATLSIKPFAHIYWVYSFLAIRDLDRHACEVVTALRNADLASARERLSWIVGRDTANLDEPEILRATIETVAENLSDGIVAPLFYLAIGGPAAMAAYKAANTLDSMVGYKNQRYIDFGRFSALADDVASFIPARLTAALICLVALSPAAIRVAMRDGASQPSPNAGYPEAAIAGALGIQLGGLNHYGGKPSPKALLGDALQPLSIAAFQKTRILLYAVALIAAAGASVR